MAKHWTEDEDNFLIHYEGVGADFVAEHDLGRPYGAGSRRIKRLRKLGAIRAYWERELAHVKYMLARGHNYHAADKVASDIETKIKEAKANE